MRADAVGVLVDPVQVVGRHHLARIEELHDGQPGAGGQPPQDRGLEGHQRHARPGVVEAVAGQVAQQRHVERQPDRVVVGGVLELEHHPDRTAPARGLRADHRQHLVERGHALDPVVRRAGRTRGRHPLAGGEGLELGQREVLDEPALLCDPVDDEPAAQVGEPGVLCDVGGGAELEVVPGDQHAVPGRDEVELDVVDAHPDGGPVGVEGVLGTVPAGAAVRNHGGGEDQRRGRVHRLAGHRHGSTVAAPRDRAVVARCPQGECRMMTA